MVIMLIYEYKCNISYFKHNAKYYENLKVIKYAGLIWFGYVETVPTAQPVM